MKAVFSATIAVTLINGSISLADISTNSTSLQDYICTNRVFAVPESFDPRDIAACQLLVRANPERFESHLLLAAAFAQAARPEAAVGEFQKADELSSKVKDPEILASLPYKGFYAFTLVAAADKCYKQETNQVHALKMLEQAVSMDTWVLREKKRLSQCYLMLAGLALKEKFYDKSIEATNKGIEAAKSENHADFISVFEDIKKKAEAFKNKKT